MKQNLLFQKILAHSKPTFIAVFCFVANVAFAQNPLLLSNPFPGSGGRSIQKIVSTPAGKTFYNTVDRINHFSDFWGLWVTDGTQAGTRKLVLSNGQNNIKEATMLTPLSNDKIVFAGDNEGGHGEVWASDGTQGGTFLLESFNSGTDAPVTIISSVNNMVIYYARDNNQHLTLRKTDGTLAGTSLVYDFGINTRYMPFSIINNYEDSRRPFFTVLNNILYFEMVNSTNFHGELWRTDGTASGTFMVKDFTDLAVSSFMAVGNNFYFITMNGSTGDNLWKSDGTTGGTTILKQISTSHQNGTSSFAEISGTLYFAANDGIHGNELWKTDGTAAGTGMIFDFYQGATGSNPQYLTVLNDQLYFSATSSFFPGNKLYSYNGSQFSQPIQQNALSNPFNLTIANNTILFSGQGAGGNELWFTGGSTPNTLEIANINPADNAPSNPGLFSVSGKNVYFAADFDANGDGISDPCIFKYTMPEKIWTGAINTDVSTADNWFPSGTPSADENVLIPAGVPTNITSGMLWTKDFTNHGSIDLNSGGVILIKGNFYNDGQVVNSNNGIFAVAGMGDHSIGNNGIYNGQFTIAGGANVHLLSDFKVNDFRTDGGTIYLGDYGFQYDTYTNFPPWFIADGNGSVKMKIGTSPMLFNVGTDANSNTSVTLTNHGDVNYFNVKVKDRLYTNGTWGNPVTTQAVNKTWMIEPVSPGNYNVDITLQWNASDELPGFDRSHVYLNHYTNGAWDNGTPGAALGSGPFSFSRTGITSFSPFTVSSSASALPVNLVSFTANKLNNAVQLNWQTVSEKNFSFFAVERSADGMIFSSLGEVPVSFNNAAIKNYSYTDGSPITGTNFYRLKMMDADGKFTYSKIVAIRFDGTNSALQIFPNPAKDILHVQVTGSNENATLQVIDLSGRKIKEQRINIDGTTSVSIDINDLPRGMYNLLLKTNSKTEHQKFVKN